MPNNTAIKKIFLLLIFIFCLLNLFAQNTGIGTTNPDASALLDISSASKGILVPRLTTAQKNTITAPAVGLLIYQTDMWVNEWVNFYPTIWSKRHSKSPYKTQKSLTEITQ